MNQDTLTEQPSFIKDGGGYYYLTVFFKKEASIIPWLNFKDPILTLKFPIEKIESNYDLSIIEQWRTVELRFWKNYQESKRLLPFFKIKSRDDE